MPLSLEDLQVGDVFLKEYFGGVVHWFIQKMTKNEGAEAGNYVHAALYIGNGILAESIGRGFSFTGLMSQGHNYRYQVFRHNNADLAQLAAHVASTLVQMRDGGVGGYRSNRFRFGKYGMGQAIGGALKNKVRGNNPPPGAEGEGAGAWEGGIRSSYCSQFVVQAYNAAGATFAPPIVPIDLASGRATPAMMRNYLLNSGSWAAVGELVAR